MEKDFRYAVQHMGDYFVGLIEVVVDAAKDSAEGVADAVEEYKVKGNRKKVVMKIGERAIAMRGENPDLFAEDDEMVGVFSDYDSLQEALDIFMAKREARKERGKERFSSCMPSAEEEPAEETVEQADKEAIDINGMEAAPAC